MNLEISDLGDPGADLGNFAAAAPRASRVVLLLILLPLIFETFHYVVDVYPLYALSKATPILLSPLALIAFLYYRLPERGWFLALALYAGLFTPFVAAINFGEGIATALTTQVKLLPVSYYFAFFFILWRLRPSYDELGRSLTILALASLILFPLLWLTVAGPTYYLSDEFTKLFLYDPERGYRINLPLFFIEIFIFLHNRKYTASGNPVHLLWVAACFVMLIAFFKERTVISGLFAIVLWARMSRYRLHTKLIMLSAVLVTALVVATSAGYFSSLAESGSVTTRSQTVAIAFAALNDEPIGWLIGLGSVSHFHDQSFTDLYGHTFYLADIGWLGMIYEYGLIGFGIFALIFYRIVRYFRRRLAATGDPLLYAFFDQVWFQIVTSVILPITFAPAEWAATFALFVYFRRRIEEGLGLPATE